MARKPGRKKAAKTHDRTQAGVDAKSFHQSMTDLRNLINRLTREQQHHIDSIAEIDQTLREFGRDGASSPSKGTRGRRKATAAAPSSPTKGRGGRRKGATAAKARQPGTRRSSPSGKFAVTGKELILQFLKDKGASTTEQIRTHWEESGRGGKAENLLTGLVKGGQVKRTKLPGIAGSSYSVS
jgi:hypothetical protein